MKIKLPTWARRNEPKDPLSQIRQPPTSDTDQPATALPATVLGEKVSAKLGTTENADIQDEQRWIENDGLLRDEGVLFGMSGGNVDAKLAVIEHYYARQIWEAERECELAGERLKTAEQALKEQHDLLQTRRKEWEELHTRLKLVAHDFLRATVGMVLYGGVIALVYFLLYDWLKPYWPQHTGLIVAGVYGFGMLSLFQRGSFLYSGARPADGAELAGQMVEHEQPKAPEQWKVILEEVGVPAVTALLAVVWGWPDHSTAQGIAMFLFLFFAFLFTGKGFLNNIVQVTAGFRAIGDNFRQRKWRKRRLAELAALQAEDAQLLEQHTATAKSLEAKRDLLPDPEQLRLQSLTKQKLFSSEYTLAHEARNVLTLEEVLTVRPD